MNKKTLWAVVVLVAVTVLVLGGGRWLWHALLRMHGIQ